MENHQFADSATDIFSDSAELVRPGALPGEIASTLNPTQKECLAFASAEFKVVSEPKIQTFQLGATTKGNIVGGGLGTALGTNWGGFGGVGVIDQKTQNAFRTDIQMKLEDAAGKKIFFQRSVPFPLTASIDPEEKITIYFAIGGFRNPVKNDFRLNDWTPFAIKNSETNQVIPLSPIPTFEKPKTKALKIFGVISFFFGIIGIIGSAGLASEGQDSSVGVSAFWLILGVVLFVVMLRRAGYWKNQYKSEKESVQKFYEQKSTTLAAFLGNKS